MINITIFRTIIVIVNFGSMMKSQKSFNGWKRSFNCFFLKRIRIKMRGVLSTFNMSFQMNFVSDWIFCIIGKYIVEE